MKFQRRAMKVLMPLGLAFLGMSCSPEVLCDYNGYGSGVDDCAADRYIINFSIRSPQDHKIVSDRTDLRALSSLPLQIEVQAKDTGAIYKLATLPDIKLTMDGMQAIGVDGSLDSMNRQSVLMSPAKLQLGALQVAVTLPGLPTVTSDGMHYVFRSPKLMSSAFIMDGVNPHNNDIITKRLTVQSASLRGDKRQVLITEENKAGSKRVLDLYEAGTAGTLGYYNDATWPQTQKDLSGGPRARLTLVNGAVVLYDEDLANVMPLLPMPPLPPTPLYSTIPEIPPNQVTALAGCSEESVVVLGLKDKLRIFDTNPASSTKPYTFIEELPVVGAPVLAVRDTLGSEPRIRSDAFFAAVWDGSGQTTLLKLLKGPGKPTAIQTKVVPDLGVSGVRAGALADIDSDGLQDLIMADQSGELWWSPQHSDGSFLRATSLGISAAGATSISVGDINNDRLPDVLVATGMLGVQVFVNQL